MGSTLGVNVYKHYCGDFLKDFSFIIQPSSCIDESSEESCMSKSNMDCCDDETDFYQLDVKFIKNNQDHIKLIPSFAIAFIQEFQNLNKIETGFSNTKLWPPPILKEIPFYKKYNQRILYA